MKQASLPLYIRFGEIPEDGQSKVHRSDQIVRSEGGVSVWRACESDNMYFPMLPEDANKHAIADYFDQLLNSNKKVYLVTGTEMFLEGADREPLLMDVKIIKDITHYYHRNRRCKECGGFANKLRDDSHESDVVAGDRVEVIPENNNVERDEVLTELPFTPIDMNTRVKIVTTRVNEIPLGSTGVITSIIFHNDIPAYGVKLDMPVTRYKDNLPYFNIEDIEVL